MSENQEVELVKFARSIKACLKNGDRILEEAEYDLYQSPTGLALAILAQEEFAKAFILQLVSERSIPWTSEVRRSLLNHECKHLIGIIMDWLLPSDEDIFRRCEAWVKGHPPNNYTADVSNAINIYRHEMIEKFGGRYYSRETEWNGVARKIAKGLKDREKQSSLYVSIANNGDVVSEPSISATKFSEEIERAKRYKELVNDTHNQCFLSHREYLRIKDILRAVFLNLETISKTKR